MKITVLGTGAWGTALAICAYENANETSMWAPFTEEKEYIEKNGENKLLPGIPIPAEIKISDDIACISGTEICVFAVPSFAIKATAEKVKPYIGENTILVNLAKGFDPSTGDRLSTVIRSILPEHHIVALCGPSHAEEVSRRIPTALVSACPDHDAACCVQNALSSERLRIYINQDIIGAELGAAVKNVIALAAGMCDGLGTGDNTKAALMTRGLKEIAVLGKSMGAKRETFAGLTGLGDLIVTCTSMHSRNRRAGILIGQGLSAEEAIQKVGTVEGYYATKIVHQLAQTYQIEMPINDICYRVCYEGLDVAEGVKLLMSRPQKPELDINWD